MNSYILHHYHALLYKNMQALLTLYHKYILSYLNLKVYLFIYLFIYLLLYIYRYIILLININNIARSLPTSFGGRYL